MKRLFLIISISQFFFGCKNKVEKIIPKGEPSTVFPTVLNPINLKYESLFDEENPTWISTANYRFNYLGKLKDTIKLGIVGFETFVPINKNSKTENRKRPNADYYIEWNKESRFKFMRELKIEIQISSKRINNFYPVLLRNATKDTIPIGHGSIIPLILEAKDKTGKWKPIQKRFSYMCGNGVGTVILPPSEIAVTLAPIFKGNFRTQLRVSMGSNKSNSFWGNINYRQFQSKFDENGEYKKEYLIENPESNDR